MPIDPNRSFTVYRCPGCDGEIQVQDTTLNTEPSFSVHTRIQMETIMWHVNGVTEACAEFMLELTRELKKIQTEVLLHFTESLQEQTNRA